LGHKNPVLTPTLLPDIAVRSISLGPSSSALIDTNGELYTFGYGGSTLTGIGQLGHGDVESVLTPKLVTSMVEDGCFAKQVEVGGNNTCVLTTEGEVLCTGAGSFGRLGNFESTDQIYFEPVELLTSGVDQIAAGKSFFLALKDGVVSGWGKNHKGQVCFFLWDMKSD
jgi:alpha-tubulin suppressor-like RCC1 family protein